MLQTHFCFHSGLGEVPQYKVLGENFFLGDYNAGGSVNIGRRSINNIVKVDNLIIVIY